MARIVCIGEGMVELSRQGGAWRIGCGGDTLNTAIHLARAGHDVAYFTALGSDDFSVELKGRWQAEGLDTSLILTHPTRHAGLYAITTDAAGERSFTYWRESSAARHLFALPGVVPTATEAGRADLVYFSLISLAILPPDGRAALLRLARAAKLVAFDGNYRPSLWANPQAARDARDAAIAIASIGLPTQDDETLLSGTRDAAAIARHWQALGCTETIVKLGQRGACLPDGNIIPPERVLAPVDTSGAGDAFNAGYISARLNGASVEEAVRSAHRLAGWTIMRPGAIPPHDS